MKQGGPLDMLSKESLTTSKSILKQLETLNANIIKALSTTGQTTMVSAPKQTNITFGQATPTTAFRQQLA